MSVFPAAVFVVLLGGLAVQERAACATWVDCREQAQAAAAAGDYERFHDLAWLAVQQGRPNDPELMRMLARAQSLSGRPLDALVMLRRLAAMNVATDAATSDDFRRVRALPGWADLERTLAGLPPASPPEPPPPAPATDAVTVPPPARAASRNRAVEEAGAPPAVSTPGGAEMLRFHAPPFTPAGLAYDRVSRRFIVGDRRGQRLAVIDEFSHQLSTLAGAGGTGFGDLAGLEIDPRDGTLWVISQAAGGGRLHKLQLISARALASFEPPASDPPARFVDVALADRGTVLVLDAAARQLLRLRAGATSLQVASSLGDRVPLSVAPAGGNVAYIAYDSGLARVPVGGGGAVDVKAADGVPLTGLVRVRWHNGSIVAIQKAGAGYRAVRLRLARGGRTVTALEVLDAAVDTADPSATSITVGTLYYLAPDDADGAMVIRRVGLGGR